MKNNSLQIIILFWVVWIVVTACGPQNVVPLMPDVTHSSSDSDTPSVQTPVPGVIYNELAEEALALQIYEVILTVEDVVKTVSTATSATLADNVLNDSETAEMLVQIEGLRATIDLTNELLDVYDAQYSEIAPQTEESLITIERNMQEIATNIDAVIALFEQDEMATVTAIAQLNLMIASIETQSNSAKVLAAAWLADVQTQIDEREKRFANTPSQPSIVAYDRVQAFVQAHDFLDGLKAALDDGKMSPDELDEISQLAVNAEASLYNTGDPLLIDFARQIDELSRYAYRGEWAKANMGVSRLKLQLPRRPRN